MKNHIIFGDKKTYLINHLCKILNFRNISYHKSELLSYSNSELKTLINRYEIKVKNTDKMQNSWYKSTNLKNEYQYKNSKQNLQYENLKQKYTQLEKKCENLIYDNSCLIKENSNLKQKYEYIGTFANPINL